MKVVLFLNGRYKRVVADASFTVSLKALDKPHDLPLAHVQTELFHAFPEVIDCQVIFVIDDTFVEEIFWCGITLLNEHPHEVFYNFSVIFLEVWLA